MDKAFTAVEGWQVQNMLTLAKLIIVSARRRTETRGVHCRRDFPDRDDATWLQPITIRRSAGAGGG